LVTCDPNRQRECAREMTDWLQQTADKLYPLQQQSDLHQDTQKIDSSKSESKESKKETPKLVSNALEEELKILQKNDNRSSGSCSDSGDHTSTSQSQVKAIKLSSSQLTDLQQRFDLIPQYTLTSKGICIFRIKEREMDPKEICSYMLRQVSESKELRSRYSVRMIPLENTCYASMENLLAMAKPIIQDIFSKLTPPRNFAIVWKRRSKNDKIKREEAIKALAAMVPSGFTVDLDNPDVVIDIQLLGRVIGMAVLTDYKELNKYHIRSLANQDPKEIQNKNEKIVNKNKMKKKQDQRKRGGARTYS